MRGRKGGSELRLQPHENDILVEVGARLVRIPGAVVVATGQREIAVDQPGRAQAGLVIIVLAADAFELVVLIADAGVEQHVAQQFVIGPNRGAGREVGRRIRQDGFLDLAAEVAGERGQCRSHAGSDYIFIK